MTQCLNLICCFALMIGSASPDATSETKIPLALQPPKIDGFADPNEWSTAVGFDGFLWEEIERRRVYSFISATENDLYLAIISQLPVDGELLSQIQADTLKVVYDDSIEVWIDPTPKTEHGKTFQMVANSLGYKGYKMHSRGNVPEEPSWQGNWKIANGFHDGYWHCEISIPISEIAIGRKAFDGPWGINICRNWKNPWSFSSLGGGAYAPQNTKFSFVKEQIPAVKHINRGDIFSGDIDVALVINNPSTKPISVSAEILLSRDMMPEINQKETISLNPNEQKELALQVKDDISKRFSLDLKVNSADGKTRYYNRSLRWQASPKWEWRISKQAKLPIDFQFAYYPYLNKMRILADISSLPKDAVLDHLSAEIRKKEEKEIVKTVEFNQFSNGQQEQTLDLPQLEGEYEIAITAFGENVPKGEIIKTFDRTVYPWEHNEFGKSRKVYPPFTPLKVKDRKIQPILREYEMNNLGLWDQVISKNKPLLSAPMTFRINSNGKEIIIKSESLNFINAEDDVVVTESSFVADTFSAKVRSKCEYDGMMLVDLTLLPSEQTLESLILEIPMRNDTATMIHAMGDGIRNTIYKYIPKGEGVVWTSEEVQDSDLPKNFCSYIYVGNPVRGLCWFAENDKGWNLDRNKPNVELIRKGDVLTLKINLINKPLTIKEERTITFGLLAAPVKPRLEPWRHVWWRDNYTLLGTDINWFALGNCGSVYPAGKDMYLWEMLKRGNKERLTDDEIKRVIDQGSKYFEPYGDYLESFKRHVSYNLRSRYGKKMVFYYNRASYQDADEFQTFEDEWSLTDYRTVGKGNGIDEIKIVPSESYIDHALYWYGKSFDIGGNLGVYWDNWFLVGSYNTVMTDAYKSESGAIIPSNGIWGLRELSKRTFQYMNERGMLPITMPHMTSTNILPMHSFATVQYDWEWKYSEGDFQYRFPREYILLVSNGDLAGTLPVLLGDHGKLADDPWTQRTFAGVCLVHEMTPSGGLSRVWEPLLNPIFRLLDDRNLEVYRYWDERTQPVVADNPDLPTIIYSLSGKEAIFVITSYAEQDAQANVKIDPEMLGFTNAYKVMDVESGEEISVKENTLFFILKKHDVREFRIVPVQ